LKDKGQKTKENRQESLFLMNFSKMACLDNVHVNRKLVFHKILWLSENKRYSC